MEKMTLTRALAEIKLIEKKIARFSDSSVIWVGLSKNGKIHNVSDLAKMKSTVDSNKQKLIELITRRNTIKHKLLEANNRVTVTIKEKTYTIAEAIDRKAFIETEKRIFAQINNQIVTVNNAFAIESAKLDEKVQNTINSALGGDGKKDPAVVDGINKSVRDNNQLQVEDPSSVIEWVKATIEDFEDFETEIDFKLSEVNSKTEIEF